MKLMQTRYFPRAALILNLAFGGNMYVQLEGPQRRGIGDVVWFLNLEIDVKNTYKKPF